MPSETLPKVIEIGQRARRAKRESREVLQLIGERAGPIEEVADWAKRAGLGPIGNRLFRRYAIAWADKERGPVQDASSR